MVSPSIPAKVKVPPSAGVPLDHEAARISSHQESDYEQLPEC